MTLYKKIIVAIFLSITIGGFLPLQITEHIIASVDAQTIPAACPTGTTYASSGLGPSTTIGCYDRSGGNLLGTVTNGALDTSVTGAYTASAATAAEAEKNAANSGCTPVPFLFDLNKCIGGIMAWFGSWFLTLGGAILLISGTLFDALLKLLVVNFSQTMESLQIMTGLQLGWELFRDLANLAIIGVFVFIAIMTILDSASYGAKRLISRVLIVAVLINFSFLFTKIIIGSANFVSAKFAEAMPVQDGVGGTNTAQSFLKSFGITDVWSGTSKLTQDVATKTGSGTAGFFYGLVGGMALLGIAAVLLYGSFIIVTRTLLLLFALLTSSLAFASFILPASAKQDYIGWNKWWSNLLKAALFGPLLMVFLWITLIIISRAAATSGAGTAVSQLATDSSKMNEAAWGSIILLAIGTGMMFISIRAASTFSKGIGGFSTAAFAPAYGAGLLARLGGIAGRQTIGRSAAIIQGQFQEKAKAASDRGNMLAARMYNLGAQKYGAVAKSDLNVMRTTLGKQVQELAGVKNLDTLAGKTVGGIKGAQDTFRKQMAENAKAYVRTKEEREKEVLKKTDAQLRADPRLAQEYAEADQKRKETKADAETVRRSAQSEQDAIVDRYKTRLRDLEADLDRKRATADAAPGDARAARELSDAERALRDSRKSQSRELNEQNERIKRATSTMKRSNDQFEDVVQKVGKAAIDSGRMPEKFATQADIAEKLTQSSLASYLRAIKPTPGGVKDFAKTVGKEAGKEWSKEDRKQTLNILKQLTKKEIEKEE